MPHSASAFDAQALGRTLLDWFSQAQRPLPWRQAYAPYQIWISEIMLQQTQMERGVEYFQRWVERFPDIAALAAADEDEVLKYWEGLGYYSRARNLIKAARIIHQHHQGHLPRSTAELRLLPGIGPYTADAIASIAFEQDVCVIDANVERVMSRVHGIDLPIKSRQAGEAIRTRCQSHLPPGQARHFNQAMMELGSLICTPRKPDCPTCPLTSWCQAREHGRQEELPVVVKPLPPIYLAMATGVLEHKGKVLIQKRMADDIWGNLWEFPGGVVEAGETPEQGVVREYLEETGLVVNHPRAIAAFRHSYTRYRVTLHAFYVELMSDPEAIVLSAAQEYRWAAWAEVRRLAFPAGHRKLIAHLDVNPEFKSRILP